LGLERSSTQLIDEAGNSGMQMMNFKSILAAVIILLAISVSPIMAAVRLGTPFGEHMVLQQGVPVPIWGTGAPGGDTVNVSIAGQNVTAKSDWEGRWMVILAPMKAGGPSQMLIQIGGYGPLIPSSAANSRGGAELNDVVIGEVRQMPPQSSAMGSSAKNRDSENAAASSAWIRVFKSPARADDLQTAASGQWTVALPGAVSNYSAASYAFALDLYNKLHVPIGVIESPGTNSAGP
jgi:sialate O-acetylesterase